jgi:osmotically-inducible protein OsmY
MSTRYGDRGFGRYGDSDEDRTENREYDARDTTRAHGDAGRDYSRGSDYGSARRGGYASARGGEYDYSRDYGYGRDYSTRDHGTRPGTREYGSGEYPPRYGREGLAGSTSRRHEAEDYGRDHAPRAYTRDAGRDYERVERARARPVRDEEGVRDYDTDYGRTTSRFYGRSGYEYGRDNYERDDDERDDRRGYARRAYAERGDERGGGSWLDRAADQVRSWFGGDDDDSDDRRREMRGGRGEGRFRGRGPRNYHRSDERVREELCDRLTDNEWLDASEVEVNVVNGEVVLTGTVDSRYAKRLAESIAESVSGVTNVDNNLRVYRYQTAEADAVSAATTTPALTSEVTAVAPGTTAASEPDLGDTPPKGRSSSRAAGGS